MLASNSRFCLHSAVPSCHQVKGIYPTSQIPSPKPQAQNRTRILIPFSQCPFPICPDIHGPIHPKVFSCFEEKRKQRHNTLARKETAPLPPARAINIKPTHVLPHPRMRLSTREQLDTPSHLIPPPAAVSAASDPTSRSLRRCPFWRSSSARASSRW
jgi:hypothetical protein